MTATSEPPVEALADEGMLVVAAALRLALKNRLILHALADDADYDEGWLLQALRDEIRALVAEKEQDNERLGRMIPRAERRRGAPYAADDYRRIDVPVLELRQRVNEALLERLHGLSEDEGALRRQLGDARDSALDEIVQPRLAPPPPPRDSTYEKERTARMTLVREDLERLGRGPAPVLEPESSGPGPARQRPPRRWFSRGRRG